MTAVVLSVMMQLDLPGLSRNTQPLTCLVHFWFGLQTKQVCRTNQNLCLLPMTLLGGRSHCFGCLLCNLLYRRVVLWTGDDGV